MDIRQQGEPGPVADKQADVAAELDKLASDVIDKSDIGIFLLDKDKNIVCWNRWMAQMSGIACDNAVGKTLVDLFSGFSNIRLQQAIDDALMGGMSSVLSPKFNPHTLPLYKSSEERQKKQQMSQLIMVKPLQKDGV